MAFLLSPSRKPYLVYLKTLRIGQGRGRGRMFGQKKVSHRNYQEFIPERKSFSFASCSWKSFYLRCQVLGTDIWKVLSNTEKLFISYDSS